MDFKVRLTSFKRLLHFVLLFVAAVGLSIAIAHPGSAQFALPEDFSQGNITRPPPSVTRYGNIETMVVRSPLSNRSLFTIASPTVYNRNSDIQTEQQTVEQRAREIQARVLIVLKREMDPETLMFGVSQLNNITVISVRDSQYTRPFILASITTNDADFNGLPKDDLAEQWLDIIEDDLRNGLAKLPRDRERVNRVLTVLFAISGIALFLKYGLAKRQKTLRKRKKEIDEAIENAPDEDSSEAQTASLREQVEQQRVTVMQKLQQNFNWDRQLAILDAIQWLLFWLLIMAWYGGFAWIFAISPYLLVDSLSFLETLLSLLTIWFVTGLSIRVSRRLIDYLSVEREGLDIGDFLTFGDTQRRQIRASTIAGAAKGLITILIALVGLLSALSALGVSTASVVAIGSLAGLAITFGSQNLVKDLVNGFFILAEDQYAIGDVIDTGTAVGLVETLNMRVTQIRSPDGELITIPNSSITQVKNLTRSWSRVAFTIDVAYDTDPDKALDMLRKVSKTFYDDTEWHGTMAAEPNVLGIDRVTHNGISITIWIETEPAQQWAVGREFRLRVRRALAEHGIDIGIPQQSYRFQREPDDGYELHQE